MAILRLEQFTGIAPRVDPKKLLEGAAQLARDCVFAGGDIRPLREIAVAEWGASAPLVVRQMHAHKDRWLCWSNDVDVVNSPVIEDQWERIYWSGGSAQSPKFATRNTTMSGGNMTLAGTDLGVPAPPNPPVIVPSQLVEPQVVAVTMSQTTPVRVSTLEDHPFEDGQRVIVTLAKSQFANSEVPPTPPERTGMVEIVGVNLVVRTVRNASTGVTNRREFDLVGADGMNYSAYDPGRWEATIKRIFTDQDKESRAYVYTYVTPYGEEGPPSPASEVIDVLKDSSVTVTVTLTPQQIAEGYRVRLYRTVTGGTSGTHFFFVKENFADAEFVDDVGAERLGELLPSETWLAPPSALTGLVSMPGGFLAGFVDNTLYFSEPYMPHAWPSQYRRTVKDTIVGLGVYGQTLVVATEGKPYLATGADPSSVSLQQLDDHAPCMKKKCVVSTGTGVIYPTFDGLVHVSAAGVRRLTEGYFTADQWREETDGAQAAAWHRGRYILSVDDEFLIFEPHQGGIHISRHAPNGNVANAFAVSPRVMNGNPTIPRDTLHMAMIGSLVAFDFGEMMQADWVGRVTVLPRPTSFACAQVIASRYPVRITVHAAKIPSGDTEPVSLVYPEASVVHTQDVAGPEPFRLPAGFVAREWRVDIATTHAVQAVFLASSMDEIKTT